MSGGRKTIGLKTKLAAALIALRDQKGNPLIPYSHAKEMTEDQVLSLFQFDHGILHGVEVNDQFWNLTPTLIVAHREKTKRDVGTVAKVKRIAHKHGMDRHAVGDDAPARSAPMNVFRSSAWHKVVRKGKSYISHDCDWCTLFPKID